VIAALETLFFFDVFPDFTRSIAFAELTSAGGLTTHQELPAH
jgi:hypothetical protein